VPGEVTDCSAWQEAAFAEKHFLALGDPAIEPTTGLTKIGRSLSFKYRKEILFYDL
jgi:hypothetical protein